MEHSAFRIDRFREITGKIKSGLSDLVATYAVAIQEAAVNNIEEMDAIDTGAMRNSVYAQLPGRGDSAREGAVASATAAGESPGRHSGEPHDVPIADEGSKVQGKYQAKVGVAVEYGVYVEMGTENTEGRPFLANAVEEVRGRQDEIARRVFRGLD